MQSTCSTVNLQTLLDTSQQPTARQVLPPQLLETELCGSHGSHQQWVLYQYRHSHRADSCNCSIYCYASRTVSWVSACSLLDTAQHPHDPTVHQMLPQQPGKEDCISQGLQNQLHESVYVVPVSQQQSVDTLPVSQQQWVSE